MSRSVTQSFQSCSAKFIQRHRKFIVYGSFSEVPWTPNEPTMRSLNTAPWTYYLCAVLNAGSYTFSISHYTRSTVLTVATKKRKAMRIVVLLISRAVTPHLRLTTPVIKWWQWALSLWIILSSWQTSGGVICWTPSRYIEDLSAPQDTASIVGGMTA